MAQIAVEPPTINRLYCPISDTVWVAPWGNDLNIGTYEAPVRSIERAAKLLPFGIPGIHDGHAWGLILLAPGRYRGYNQHHLDYFYGGVYRNISIEGLRHHPLSDSGRVVIGGDALGTRHSPALSLSGSHIYVKDVMLRDTRSTGLSISNDDVLLLNIDVDSTGDVGISIGNANRVEIVGCTVSGASQYFQPYNSCSASAGLRLIHTSNVQIKNCHIRYTRGNGIFIQNSHHLEVIRNIIHDNPNNIHIDQSGKIEIQNNYIFNSKIGETQYWNLCSHEPFNKNVPGGLVFTNTGQCSGFGSGEPSWTNCKRNCDNSSNEIVDSLFVYNNVFQNIGTLFRFADGILQYRGNPCIKNVHILFNTSIGTMGDPQKQEGLLHFKFPVFNSTYSIYAILDQVHITNNVFGFDAEKYPNYRAILTEFAPGHPAAEQYEVNGNLWNHNHVSIGNKGAFRIDIPKDLSLIDVSKALTFSADDFWQMVPCLNRSYLQFFAMPTSFSPLKDANGMFRNRSSNVGAFENKADCPGLRTKNLNPLHTLDIYPNPVADMLKVDNPVFQDSDYKVLSIQGKMLMKGRLEHGVLHVSELPSGVYIIHMYRSDLSFASARFVKL